MNLLPTLLLTGANNHDWQRTSPFLACWLEKHGFGVTVAIHAGSNLENFELLNSYSLIVSDYNGPLWNEGSRRNFAAAIENGAGLVIFHSANNCFEGWKEYEQMCALGFRESSGHGDFADCEVEIVPGHPVTIGLTSFATTDEIYHGMVRVVIRRMKF